MIELPPKVAKAFIADMQEFHATFDKHKRDEIAARQLHVLRGYVKGKFRLSDVRELFDKMLYEVANG